MKITVSLFGAYGYVCVRTMGVPFVRTYAFSSRLSERKYSIGKQLFFRNKAEKYAIFAIIN